MHWLAWKIIGKYSIPLFRAIYSIVIPLIPYKSEVKLPFNCLIDWSVTPSLAVVVLFRVSIPLILSLPVSVLSLTRKDQIKVRHSNQVPQICLIRLHFCALHRVCLFFVF